MSMLEIMKLKQPYCVTYEHMPNYLQDTAKKLCFDYNHTSPKNKRKRSRILKKLLGTYHPQAIIQSSFQCDYGFNIHIHGLVLLNYNCVILDTSPVNIGKNTFIGPGTVIACAGHAIMPEERAAGIQDSKPITIEEAVWIGANVTVCGGVTIGKGSIIGAGSVVTKDIPAGVIAVGNPCKVLREITKEDRMKLTYTGE